jgi:hypothetical protein
MIYMYDIDVDTICCLFVCADVAPRGHEVELRRASARQELERPSWRGPRVGERHRREDIAVRPADPERAARRRRFDDPSVGPSHAPPTDAEVDFDDIRRRLEAVLQGVPEGMWSRIQDEGILEQCVGIPPPWRAVVRWAAVVGAVMTERLPPGQEGPIVGGGPPHEGGVGGGSLEAP